MQVTAPPDRDGDVAQLVKSLAPSAAPMYSLAGTQRFELPQSEVRTVRGLPRHCLQYEGILQAISPSAGDRSFFLFANSFGFLYALFEAVTARIQTKYVMQWFF
jgi:hypothetical protein